MKYDIGICIPATSKGNRWKVWEDCDLKHSIDSILQTNSSSIKIKFYFCFDEDDKFYNQVKIRGMITFDTFTHNLQKKGNVVGMWNLLAERAKDECEYVMATGSDIKYLDNDWIIEAMNSLKKQNNIGLQIEQKLARQVAVRLEGQALGQQIRQVFIGGNVSEFHVAVVAVVAHEVIPDVDVATALVQYGVAGQQNGCSIIVEKGHWNFPAMDSIGEMGFDVVLLA